MSCSNMFEFLIFKQWSLFSISRTTVIVHKIHVFSTTAKKVKTNQMIRWTCVCFGFHFSPHSSRFRSLRVQYWNGINEHKQPKIVCTVGVLLWISLRRERKKLYESQSPHKSVTNCLLFIVLWISLTMVFFFHRALVLTWTAQWRMGKSTHRSTPETFSMVWSFFFFILVFSLRSAKKKRRKIWTKVICKNR